MIKQNIIKQIEGKQLSNLLRLGYRDFYAWASQRRFQAVADMRRTEEKKAFRQHHTISIKKESIDSRRLGSEMNYVF